MWNRWRYRPTAGGEPEGCELGFARKGDGLRVGVAALAILLPKFALLCHRFLWTCLGRGIPHGVRPTPFKLISEISTLSCNDLEGLRMPTVLSYVLWLMFVSGFESHSLRQH